MQLITLVLASTIIAIRVVVHVYRLEEKVPASREPAALIRPSFPVVVLIPFNLNNVRVVM